MVRPVTLENKEFSGFRRIAANIVENKFFIRAIIILIIVNAITIGLETNKDLMKAYGTYFHLFDHFVIGVFVVEVALKLYAYRLSFFKVGWNIFDFIIVAISLIPSAAGLSILRALRIFRLFRLFSLVPQMRNVIGALLHAIPGMASIIGILLVLIYISAVLATQFFGQNDDPIMYSYFGDVSHSMYTMFQLMTLEDWPDIANPTMELYPWAWTFFIPFIIITTFAVLNLFIGIIVDALNIVKEQDISKKEKNIQEEIRELKSMVSALKKDIKSIRNASQHQKF
jgi:voltage-gated sodium channel